jgi:hypothetical protein
VSGWVVLGIWSLYPRRWSRAQPRGLHPRAVRDQVYHLFHVSQLVGYKVGYIFFACQRIQRRHR